MTVLRMGLTLARSYSKPLFNAGKQQQLQINFIGLMASRSLSTMQVTKNLSLISGEKKQDVKIDQLRLSPPQQKPLVVMLTWLLSRRKHINKYAQVYVDRGFDVLTVSITPWQLLWPTKGTQLVARDILKFIDVNFNYSPMVLHGFSVGGYVWGEVMVQMAAELPKYQPVIDRVVGQVWDSAADITEIPIGLPFAVFPKNPVLQAALRKYILYHMKSFHKSSTVHYLRSSQMFHTNIIKVPALMFLSKTDPVGAEASNQRVRESWEGMGMHVYWKCWDRSPHVGHFLKHPEEYRGQLDAYLDEVCSGAQAQQAAKAKL